MDIDDFIQGKYKPKSEDVLQGKDLDKVYWFIRNSMNEKKRSELFWKANVDAVLCRARELKVTEEKIRKSEKREMIQQSIVAHSIANRIQHITHDVKHPFEALMVLLQQLKLGNVDSENLPNYLEYIEKKSKYVDSLLDNLLHSGNEYKNELEAVDLRLLLANLLTEETLKIDGKKIWFCLDFNHSGTLFVDGFRVTRLLRNLIGNAMDSMSKNAHKIWISSIDVEKNSKSFVEVTVRNEGSYVPEDLREEIFFSFCTAGKTGRTGLGLAICLEIVRSHGGEIICKSDHKKGTEFVFTLPIV